MGYDLYSQNGKEDGEAAYFRWNIGTWSPLLKLARIHGWLPQGTTIFLWDHQEKCLTDEVDKTWNGSYFSNDSQVVGTFDAEALADALEKALDDLPDKNLYPKSVFYSAAHMIDEIITTERKRNPGALIMTIDEFMAGDWDKAPDVVVVSHENDHREFLDNPHQLFSGVETKDYIRKFIQFCRMGSFEIR